jgi:hypothetical protein
MLLFCSRYVLLRDGADDPSIPEGKKYTLSGAWLHFILLSDVMISLLLHHFGKPGEDDDGMTSSGDALRRQASSATLDIYGQAYLFATPRTKLTFCSAGIAHMPSRCTKDKLK